MALHWQIVTALIAAFVMGALFGTEAAGIPLGSIYAFVGGLFLDALKMLIVPLIVASIISGVASIGSAGGVGALAGRTAIYYLFSTTLAVTTALLVMNTLLPGMADGQPLAETVALPPIGDEVSGRLEGKELSEFFNILRDMVPANIVAAGAEAQMLGLIFFAILFGIALTRVTSPKQQVVKDFWAGVQDVMIQITHWVMKVAPIGVFALVAGVIAESGLSVLLPMLDFFMAVVIGLAIHAVVVLPLVIWLVARRSPIRFVQAIWPALLVAFSTSSSAGTLPVTLNALTQRAKVSRETSSFVLPLGATINMDGTALYECAAVLFIAQAYGVDLSLSMQVLIVVLALVTSIGVAAVPSASLVAIALILGVLGLPLEAMGLLLVVDRLLDMLRTSVNVYSDATGAVVVARLRGEERVLMDTRPDEIEAGEPVAVDERR
ncbi:MULTISPECIES: dicarboxylate/amino acid:cation symporter [unclassified Guyparkeria]|uniref:dicarboxylate/amino acid:cation symporter n=1 Tax=unclassified Guyparkeria TaxID=2626246 RepID=UPI0007335609|nr:MULTISPECIES: dicarboxylate/amino acid:cation symporter [unclassified Guyparkeria]KTG17646.1 sodium:dicarboxylate symporter [Guyparkeria sp. XI15]OAE88459.1 sodium:dicarboxylate symporter [Guyparkeria sp. WRN-7]